MNIRYNKGLLLVMLFSILLSSCFDEDLFDRDLRSDRKEWTPDYTAPAGYITYSMEELIKLNKYTVDFADEDESDYLAVKFRKEDFFTFNIDSVVFIPDVQPSAKCVITTPGTGTHSESGQIFMNVYKSSVSINNFTADLKIKVTKADFPADWTIDVTFPGVLEGGVPGVPGVPVKRTFKRNVGDDLNDKIVLTGVEIDCSHSGKNNIDYEVTLNIPATTTATVGANFDFDFKIYDCVIKQTEGRFGEIPLKIEPAKIPVDLSLLDKFDISDPKIKLISTYNTLDIPFAVDADFIGRATGGTEVSIRDGFASTILRFGGHNHDPLIYTPMPDKVEIMQYDETNSKVADMFNLPPDAGVEYGGEVILNQGAPGNINFIKDYSVMNMDALFELPLCLKDEGITLRDTLVDIDISSEMTKDIEKLAMNVLFTHENYPLKVDVSEIFFFTEGYASVEKLYNEADIDPADIGTVLAYKVKEVYKDDKTKSKYIIELPIEIVERMGEFKHIGLEMVFAPGVSSMPIPYGMSFDMDVSLSVKLDLGNK